MLIWAFGNESLSRFIRMIRPFTSFSMTAVLSHCEAARMEKTTMRVAAGA